MKMMWLKLKLCLLVVCFAPMFLQSSDALPCTNHSILMMKKRSLTDDPSLSTGDKSISSTELVSTNETSSTQVSQKQERSDRRSEQTVDFDWSRNQHDVPVFISDLHNEPGNNRLSTLWDRAIVRAPWNLLTAKMFRLVAVFFLESYLVQLFGVSQPIEKS